MKENLGDEDGQESVKVGVSDALSCVICYEPWTSESIDHRVCCLHRCGHLFCFSCIIQLIEGGGGGSAKCPLCRELFTRDDVTTLNGTPVVLLDVELKKINEGLVKENESLQSKMKGKQIIDDDGEQEREEMDTIFDVCCCVICCELWTNESINHRVCCIHPCGHQFCFSCINQLIQIGSRGSGKCPLCRNPFTRDDVTKHYETPVVLLDEELKRINDGLVKENEILRAKIDNLLNEISPLKKQKNPGSTSNVKSDKQKQS